jgi:hypothetical protein
MPAACEGGEASDATAQLAEAPAVTYLSAPVNTTVGSWAQVLATASEKQSLSLHCTYPAKAKANSGILPAQNDDQRPAHASSHAPA